MTHQPLQDCVGHARRQPGCEGVAEIVPPDSLNAGAFACVPEAAFEFAHLPAEHRVTRADLALARSRFVELAGQAGVKGNREIAIRFHLVGRNVNPTFVEVNLIPSKPEDVSSSQAYVQADQDCEV